ncbi:MAG TPA: hypothetical protein VK588_00920, partial [Chitinophagaceae bacterium]|nr:hypothetical protein [Chitinophagaceae bacterium]
RCNSYLAYYSRNRGISLAFDVHQANVNINLVKQDNGSGPIKYEERFAIHVAGGGYLKYQQSIWGINLDYSTTPVFEWKFRDNSFGPQQPKNVNSHDILSLFNTYNEGYMLYGERDYGPNLNWSDKPSTVIAKESPYNTGGLLLTLKSGPYPTPSLSGKFSGRITWTFIPVQLTGAYGEHDKAFSIDKFYEGPMLSTKSNEWWAFYNEVVTGLKMGKWKIMIQTPGWNTECQVDVGNGSYLVNFELNKNACRFGHETQIFQTQLHN